MQALFVLALVFAVSASFVHAQNALGGKEATELRKQQALQERQQDLRAQLKPKVIPNAADRIRAANERDRLLSARRESARAERSEMLAIRTQIKDQKSECKAEHSTDPVAAARCVRDLFLGERKAAALEARDAALKLK